MFTLSLDAMWRGLVFFASAIAAAALGAALISRSVFGFRFSSVVLGSRRSYEFDVDVDFDDYGVSGDMKHAAADNARSSSSSSVSDEKAFYERLVIVLVDALRADMVFEREEMSYLRGLLSRGGASGWLAKAGPPTVTMPRISAITTGKFPSFLDAARNLNAGALGGDNLLRRLKAKGKRLVLLGDETWLKLFPGMFDQHDATSSFFTKDTVTVDANITRHFPRMLDPAYEHPSAKDWDVAIMHYLGVDHVGHQHGPDSPIMHAKLLEMDAAIETAHRSLSQQDARGAGPTLLVVLSDHGMNKGGNHGGASRAETSAVAVFVNINRPGVGDDLSSPRSSKLQSGTISQIDVLPTISRLMGVHAPFESCGRLIPEAFVEMVSASRRHNTGEEGACGAWLAAAAAARKNSMHLRQIVRRCGIVPAPDNDEDEEEAMLASRVCSNAFEKTKALSKEALASQNLLRDHFYGGSLSSGIDTGALFGLALLLAAALSTHWMLGGEPGAAVCNVEFASHATLALALASSSAIENEHAAVFFALSSTLILRFVVNNASNLFQTAVMLALTRAARSRLEIINWWRLSCEQKEKECSSPTFLDEKTAVLVPHEWLSTRLAGWLSIVGICLLCDKMIRDDVKRREKNQWIFFLHRHVLCAGPLFAGIARLSDVDGSLVTTFERASLLCAAITFCLSPLPSFTALQCLLQRSSDMPFLFVATLLVERFSNAAALRSQCIPRRSLAAHAARESAFAVLIGRAAFYALGNSHVMSTVNFSGAYSGLEDYTAAVVGALTLLVVQAGPLLALLALFRSIRAILANLSCDGDAEEFKLLKRKIVRAAASAALLCGFARMAFMGGVLLWMQSHLFVWTVFSPRWFYEVAACFSAAVFVAGALVFFSIFE